MRNKEPSNKEILANNIESFNRWHETEIDTDGLGAGGSKEYLIIKGTQNKLTSKLMSASDLIDEVRLLSQYMHYAGLQRKEEKQK